MINNGVVNIAERGQQLVGLLLSTMPLAERMLLYNLAMAVWVMVPHRGLLNQLRQSKAA